MNTTISAYPLPSSKDVKIIRPPSTYYSGKYVYSRIFYRLYRKMKEHFLTQAKPSLLGKLFFILLNQVNFIISPRNKTTIVSRVEMLAWKSYYGQRFPSPHYQINSERRVALHSDDHKWPRGTLYDNSIRSIFNLKAYELLGFKHDFSLLDLGCSGGGLVRSVIEDGYVAVGVEGSDISKRLRSGEWGSCPYHLFTADIAEPFEVMDPQGNLAQFDMVTSWEVLEHIPEERVETLVINIKRHLAPKGYFIGSVDLVPDGDIMTGARYHVIFKPKSWWILLFEKHGFKEVHSHPFEVSDYVRGNGQTFKDWDPRDGDGFHLVMQLVSK